MKQEHFLAIFTETLGIGHELFMQERLENLEEWDSLGLVSFLSIADVQFQKKLSVDMVKNAQRVEDLYLLLQK